MALLFFEGFEQYSAVSQLANYGSYFANSSLGGRWGTINDATRTFIETTTYRTTQPAGTSKSLRFTSPNAWNPSAGVYFASEADLIVGVAVNASLYPDWKIRLGSPTSSPWLGSGATHSISLGANTSQQLIVDNNRTAARLLTTASNTFYTNTWHYIEMKINFSATGSIEVRCDGITVGTVSGVDTRAHTSSTGYHVVALGFPGTVTSAGTSTAYYDDFYICNTSGGTNNNFLGSVKVYTLFPTANGTTNQFTPVGAATNWDAVKEQGPDTTTYVSTSSANQVDMYGLSDMGVTPTTIHGVITGSWSTKTENTPRQVRNKLTVSGNTSNGTTCSPIIGSYLHAQDLFITTPTGGAWTQADVDAMQIGVESI